MKLKFRTCSILLVASLLSLAACGDDGNSDDGGSNGGAACGGLAACGGDPTGSWTIEETCLDSSTFAELTEGCDAEIDASGVEMVGTAEFRADSTYVTTSTLQGPMKIVYPPSCLTMEGVTITCEQLDASMQEVVGDGALLASASCVAAGQGCACTLVLEGSTTTGEGTWSVSGTSLTLAPDGQEPDEVPFCVEGSSLTMAIETETGTDAEGKIPNYLRLTKQ
ncbi:hypothetical protein [Sorangium sp. So ce861]|uniref:hypothetical protein n=1 Tax=Sorangium sp. So ce861 TaxID=3133323 RepID=UPI003F5D7156